MLLEFRAEKLARAAAFEAVADDCFGDRRRERSRCVERLEIAVEAAEARHAGPGAERGLHRLGGRAISRRVRGLRPTEVAQHRLEGVRRGPATLRAGGAVCSGGLTSNPDVALGVLVSNIRLGLASGSLTSSGLFGRQRRVPIASLLRSRGCQNEARND